ncbi:TRAP transporter substrate-binding protein [Bordetella sp. LUAb4]|uniref:TRAP transporter substrate-binding protein n=1 Tax=Bordetella sp. LUAb4 TaxID=2843195 RepID=UPI001E307CBC|nr:TRAP transporter substrate-binding protein [Bordetella sp. LUAb4]
MRLTPPPARPSRRAFLQTAAAGAAALAAPNIMAAPAAVALRCSSSQPADQSAAQFIWYDRFAANLKQAVGDRIRVDFFPNGQLGKEADVVQQVRLGSVDMMITGSSIWATALPELALLDMGFLFDSWDHVNKSVDAGVGAQFDKLLQERTGCTFLGWGNHFNARSVYTKKPVLREADLKNVKLRVLPTPIFVETFKLMGAIPTPIPVNELYTAVQTGVVDGFEHDAATVLSSKFNEVVSNCWLTNHLFSPSITAIGKRGLAKVPKDLLPAFHQAAKDADNFQRQAAGNKGKDALAALEKAGIAFHPMDPAERQSIRHTMETKLWPTVTAQYPVTKPMLDIINAQRG